MGRHGKKGGGRGPKVGAASRRGGEEQEEQVRRAIQHDQLEVTMKAHRTWLRGGDLPTCASNLIPLSCSFAGLGRKAIFRRGEILSPPKLFSQEAGALKSCCFQEHPSPL